MAGTLTVQNLQGPSSGANANKIIVPSGHTLDASSGLVPAAGQIVKRSALQYFYTAEGTTSTTFVDATGGSISFSCDYADSLVQINLVCMVGGKGALRLLAGSTAVTTSSQKYNYYTPAGQTDWNSSSVRRMVHEVHFYEPSSTNAVTYKVQYAAYQANSSAAFGINELHNALERKYSHLEILEIKQ